MEPLEIRDWKMGILIITAKIYFCKLISQMLDSYIAAKSPKNFRDTHLTNYKKINSYKQFFQKLFLN